MNRPESSLAICDSCGAEAVRVVRRFAEYTKGRTKVSFPEDVSICDACGDAFYTREQMEQRNVAISAALEATAANPFTPDRIRRALANVGMSPAQFERAVGLGNKTVSRWERGAVPPSQAAKFALWVAERFPSVIKAHAAEVLGEPPIPEVRQWFAETRAASSATFTAPHLRLVRSETDQGVSGRTDKREIAQSLKRELQTNEA